MVVCGTWCLVVLLRCVVVELWWCYYGVCVLMLMLLHSVDRRGELRVVLVLVRSVGVVDLCWFMVLFHVLVALMMSWVVAVVGGASTLVVWVDF
ncbi:unnamed protein product [Sphenostylis stenocarpa]|uniref:Transmembrane protein n=1 Tax=Sphenostylis stenocarpa TaxID=92480 RepID=A0AA86S8T7_9FABA|nr:unnamed protein product [Sphenostylis stenocarpa]